MPVLQFGFLKDLSVPLQYKVQVPREVPIADERAGGSISEIIKVLTDCNVAKHLESFNSITI